MQQKGSLYGISYRSRSSLSRSLAIRSLERSTIALIFVRLIVFFCLSALERAFRHSRPMIFNNDQGSQFTSRLEVFGIAIGWNGRRSYFDNIFIERLWRSFKYEGVYLNHYDSMNTAHCRLRHYLNFYNRESLHQSLAYRTPACERIASAVGISTRCISDDFRR